MRPLLSLLLSVLIVLFPAAGTAAAADSRAPAAVDWAEMEYARCDGGAFLAEAERLAALAKGSDAQAVIEAYDSLYAQFVHIDTMDAVAYINASRDVTDEYWSGESQYSENLRYETADALSTACHAVTQGPCAEAFADHVGQAAYDAFCEHVPMTGREAELLARETELVDEYYRRMNDLNSVTYSYMDEDWDLEKLGGFSGYSLAARDQDGYMEVYYGLHQAVNELVGPIFLELVQLRAEIADIEGWDSYAAMAYHDVYGRDYSLADAQTLCDAVKAIGQTYYAGLYGSSMRYGGGAVSPARRPEELLELLGEYVGEMDPILEAPYAFMMEHGLYDMAGGADRFPGAYTITLGEYDSAFIFATPGYTFDGLSTLTHEFGHFVNNYYHPANNLLTDIAGFDLLEIHSTGLETLFTAFYDQFFDAGADTARFSVLSDLIEALIDGCLFDEFQRRIYDEPDMTLDEMNRLYARLCASYGEFEPTEIDYTWIYVSHTFESPLYYLSYAASALAAIQLWDMAQTDMRAAVDAWKAVLSHDASTEGYCAVLPACGLRLFTEDGAVADICRPLLQELSRLDAGE